MEQTEVNIYMYTQKKLKAHFQNTEEFNLELALAFEYYSKKLSKYISEEDKQEKMKDMLFNAIKSQIFNGYYMAQELLTSDDADFQDDWFKQSINMISKQLPDLIRKVTDNNFEEVVTHDQLTQLVKWLVVEFEGVYPTLMDISLNTACLGAKWAFIDEGEKRKITQYEPSHNGILAKLDDFTFINPQNYLSRLVSNQFSEVWEIINSEYRQLQKIGEVTLLKIPIADIGLFQIYANFSLAHSLSEEEQDALIQGLGNRIILENNITRDDLMITSNITLGYYQFNNLTDF